MFGELFPVEGGVCVEDGKGGIREEKVGRVRRVADLNKGLEELVESKYLCVVGVEVGIQGCGESADHPGKGASVVLDDGEEDVSSGEDGTVVVPIVDRDEEVDTGAVGCPTGLHLQLVDGLLLEVEGGLGEE